MKLVRDILNLGSTVMVAGTATTNALMRAGSSYALEWEQERELELASSKLERAKRWDLLNKAIDASDINVNSKKEALAKLEGF